MIPGKRSDAGHLIITPADVGAESSISGGVALMPDGSIYTTNLTAPTDTYDGGHRTASNGALLIDSSSATAKYVNGLPITDAGALATSTVSTDSNIDPFVGGVRVNVTTGRIPVDVIGSAFSDGFDVGFR